MKAKASKSPSRTRSLNHLVKEAYAITQNHRELSIFGIFSAAIGIVVGLVYFAFRINYFLPGSFEFLSFLDVNELITFVTDHTKTSIFIGFGLVILGLLYLVLPVICDAAIIGGIGKIKEHGEHLSSWHCLATGVQSFLKLLEYEALTIGFDITKSVTVLILLWRYFGIEVLQDLIVPICIVLVFMLIVSIWLVYAKYNIILHDGEVMKSILKSFTLVTFYAGETLMIFLILGLILLQTVIGYLLVFAVPVGILMFMGYLLKTLSWAATVAISVFLFLIIFVVAVRVAAFLKIFTNAIWTLTFLEISSRGVHKAIEEK